MKKYSRRILAGIMSFVMLLTMVFPVQVRAGDGTGDTDASIAAETEFSENDTYVIAADGKAAYTDGTGWQSRIKFDSSIYDSSRNMITKKTAQFKIKPEDEQNNLDTGETRVKISCCINDNEDYKELRTETSQEYGWIDDRTDNTYIIKKTSDGKYIIRESTVKEGGTDKEVESPRYASVNANGELAFLNGSTDTTNVTEFNIVKNPEYIDTSITIKHAGTQKYLKTYENAGDYLTVDGESNDKDILFSEVKFYKAGNMDYTVASFISKSYNKGINTTDGSAKMYNSDGIGGWESIRIIPNGDTAGTISFRVSQNNKIMTVDNDKHLTGTDDITEDNLTDNEKFIIHTVSVPDTVTGVTADNSTITASTIDLSWEYPQTLFTNMVLYYKKTQDGNWMEKDLTRDEMLNHSCTVTGLDADTEYNFKLQVIMKSDGGTDELKSSESSQITASTNNAPAPADTPAPTDNPGEITPTQTPGETTPTQAPEETTPTQAPGGEVADSVVPDGDYAIISKTTGFALNTKVANWIEESLRVDALYDAPSGKIGSANAQFTIEKTGNYGDAVRIICHFDGETYPIRVEGGNEYGFADPGQRNTEDEHFIIESTGNSTFKIKTYKGRYATVDPAANKLLFKADTTAAGAEEFTFLKNPALFDTSIYIQHKSSGKYVKTYETDGSIVTVNAQKGDKGTVFSGIVFGTNAETASGEEYVTASFVSKDYGNGMGSVSYDQGINGAKAAQVVVVNDESKYGKGWESIRIIPNGDGTVSFKDSYFDQYITVQGISMACRKIAEGTTKNQLTDKEKFIICTDNIPEPVTGFEVNDRTRTMASLDLTWKNPLCLYTSAVIEQKKAGADDSEYKTIATLADEEKYTVTGLEKGTDYKFRIRLDFYNGTDTYSSRYAEAGGSTIETERPAAPSNVHVKESAPGVLELSWDKTGGANGYKIYEARSKYDKEGYKQIGYITSEKITIPTASETGDAEGRDKYSYYFYVQAVAGTGSSSVESDESETVSLETEMFGEHTIFFAETDDVKEIDKVLADIFEDANDFDKDAQFNGQQWQIYFKPGDYTETSCMYLGFYTSFNGLGKTPYDVKLNNIAIPAYLPAGELSDGENNATCNFWRSTENLSVMFTGNKQGRAMEQEKNKKGEECYRPESFNWAVAQAAPLRRVYSERPVAYDWNFGWASGGYVADCYFVGADENGNSAGTASGQQFFTRNSKVDGNTFGTTLNNFYLGVEAENNLASGTGTALKNNNGFTNWGIAGNKDSDGKIPQQVVTEITETPEISEKPFLYFDNGEYKIFVPAVQKNRRGISWGEGKANDGMGEGTILPLSDFYIANPSDSAAKINEQITTGKNIYFTPGIYHAEEPIVVNKENAILLGSGMASIIPDNDEMAMKVLDLDGIRIEGLIFDAGKSSKYLLQVGEKKTGVSHSSNPIILQDLFFRVGGTTDVLTKADDAIEINCNNVIGDHFWIWRADHGAGVEWYGNESKHGLIVNGDNVKCYALFNEHFQEYHTLWNGENGATYFYQNETCYDPISQEAWMSHGGTVKGYSSYKVSNDVKNHYAAGLGIYNVFIYTGPSYDAKGVGIQLDNAIEVPNSENVLVENACIQTFANDDGALARINHIINGVGGSASSGYNSETGERGESWSRKFLLYYNNGMAEYGKETDPSTFNFVNGKDPKDQRNQFIGTEKRTAENPVEEPEDEKIFLDRIEQLVKELSAAVETDYTKNSWRNANLEEALAKAREMIEIGKQVLEGSYDVTAGLRRLTTYSQYDISKIQSEINKACTTLEASGEKLVYIGNATRLHNVCYETIKEEDYQKNDKWYAYINALSEVERILSESEERDISTKKKIYELQLEIDAAYEALRLARLNLTGEDDALNITGLREAYDKYAAYNQAEYTSGSWTEFAKALADAKAELDKGTNAVQEDIDAALAALNAAAGKLVKVSSGSSTGISGLKEAYDKYSAYKQSDYKIEGWAEFAKALADAKAQLDKGSNASESDVAAALAALNTAAGKLVRNSNSSSGSSGGGSSLDSWLEGMLANALAANTNSDIDTGKLLDAIAGLTDAKTDMDETQGKADALFEVINSLIGNATGGAVSVKSVKLNKSSVSLAKGKKAVLKATITPANAANKNIIWNSNNIKVATVDKNGNVKAVGKGTANITAVTADGLKKAVCKVTVTVLASKVTLNRKNVYIVKGQSIPLKAVMTPSGTTDKIKWSTSKASVASVKAGNVKAKKAGTAVITAKASSGKKAKCKVYVVNNAKKAASVQLNKKKVSIKKGGWVLLNAVLKPAGSTDTVKWKSSNKKIASVDLYGFVKAKKKGKATITALTEGGKKVKCKITVK